MNRKAYDAIIMARTKLIVRQPFFGTLALHLKVVEDPDLPFGTMATDGRHLFYTPTFVLSLSDEELVGVMAHETFHCAYQHMTRRKHREAMRWNVAGDYVINSGLLKDGFTLPKERLHDPKYDGMSTDEVYERLPVTPVGKGGVVILSDSGRTGGVLDAAPTHDKNELEKITRMWEQTIRIAVNVARMSHASKLPGSVQRLVEILDKPKVSWRELTYQFIDESMTKDYSFKRLNRRYISSGMIMPGFVPDALHHLVMIVDTSGSITEKMLKAYVSEIAGALDDGVADQITVLYADTKVQHVDVFNQGDVVTAKIVGGGGTHFDDSFRWVRENAADASCIIYLTDMETASFGKDPDIPVLWAAYAPGTMLTNVKAPFGTIIHVESSE